MSKAAVSSLSSPNVRVIPAKEAASRDQTEVRAEPKFPWLTIAICAVLMALYTGSPIDLIPDFIPGLGQLDDFLVDAGLLGVIARAVLRYFALKHLTRGGVKNFFKKAFIGRFFRWRPRRK